MKFNILVVKETKALEARVGLTPGDVAKLIQAGHKVAIEHEAGSLAGFSNAAYAQAGATIRRIENTEAGFAQLFEQINLIVRVKRAELEREAIETKVIVPGTIMLGALDPLEKNSPHIQNYYDANIIPYSIDQLHLAPDNPMNVLAAMSKIAGQMAVKDALAKFNGQVSQAVIIGYGEVGKAAFKEARKENLAVTVVLGDPTKGAEIISLDGKVIALDYASPLEVQQDVVKQEVLDADIVITSARKPRQIAPLLIPSATLNSMRAGSVIVDMALSEGGNVEGSEHDATHVLGNGVIVTNVSGYPKAVPNEASILWSKANLRFIELLAKDLNASQLSLARC
jgi:NAD/NADP transhydrogenase alpha subunit